jgi:hypothetical protein
VKAKKSFFGLSNLFLFFMLASMTTLLISSCDKIGMSTADDSEIEYTQNLSGETINSCLGPLTITKGKMKVKQETKYLDVDSINFKVFIRAEELHLVDTNRVRHETNESISWKFKIGQYVQTASFKVKFSLKSHDQKIIAVNFTVRFDPRVPGPYIVERGVFDPNNLACLGLN